MAQERRASAREQYADCRLCSRSTLDNLPGLGLGKVTWTNHDEAPHSVVSTGKLFASPALDTGEQVSQMFTKPGEYGYYCSIHPKMTGKVVVE